VGYELTDRGAEMLGRADHAADVILCELTAHLTPDERDTAFEGLALWRRALDARRSGA